ncbi:MAG: L-serine ammonia-lyase, iron-sulfur-dependent, subunit alpha [Anaerovoracaceae bacterium]
MYNSLKKMVQEAQNAGLTLWEIIMENEVKHSEKTKEEIRAELKLRMEVMRKSTETAIDTPEKMSKTFISGMAKTQEEYRKKGDTLCGNLVNKVMAKALSASEVNAAMGKICAMPTAGSCGIVPAVLFAVAEEVEASHVELENSFLIASGLGAVVVANATVSGAEGGCQAECGVAAAMAAAGAAYLKGGNNEQCLEAFAISIINIMGLICDPVAGLVQIPCAQRNASQGVNALSSADLALGGMKCGIEADDVIEAMYKVGKLMPVQHRETSLGGIAVTKSGKSYKIEDQG